MITPVQAIQKATQKGYCRISRYVYLWLTDDAKKQLRINVKTKFFLITESRGFEDPLPVSTEKNRSLIKVCK